MVAIMAFMTFMLRIKYCKKIYVVCINKGIADEFRARKIRYESHQLSSR